jgi:hypothetical protein
LPLFIDALHGILPTKYYDRTQTDAGNMTIEVNVTEDGGVSWSASTPLRIPGAGAISLGNFAIVTSNDWWAAFHDKLFATSNAGRTWTTIAPDFSSVDPLPTAPGDHISYALDYLSFPSNSQGWAILNSEHCPSGGGLQKGPGGTTGAACPRANEVIRSADGGRTWSVP